MVIRHIEEAKASVVKRFSFFTHLGAIPMVLILCKVFDIVH